MRFKFKPEDFKWLHTHSFKLSDISDQANELLQAHLATLPRVYGKVNQKDWIEGRFQQDTHTALLWDVTEIENKECEHEPIRNEKGEILIGPDNKAVCGECEEYLIIAWKKA